ISQSYKKTLRTHMAFALATADVAPLEDDDREDGEQHQVAHQGDPATSRIDQLGARIRTAKGQPEAGIDGAGVDAGEEPENFFDPRRLPQQLADERLQDEQEGQSATNGR